MPLLFTCIVALGAIAWAAPQFGSLEVTTHSPQGATFETLPTIELLNDGSEVVSRSMTGDLRTERLLPGSYTLTFSDIEGMITPKPIQIDVQPGENVGPLKVEYRKALGGLAVVYSTGKQVELLDKILFTLEDQKGNRKLFPLHSQFLDNHVKGERTVVINDMPPGDYTLKFESSDKRKLFKDLPVLKATVRGGKVTTLQHTFDVLKGSFESSVVFDEAVKENPKITLKNESGRVIAYSASGALEIKDLVVGNYTAEFEQLDGFYSPSPMPITITPGVVTKTLPAKYTAKKGQLVVTYSTGSQGELLDEIKFTVSGEKIDSRSYPEGHVVENLSDFTHEVAVDLPIGTYTINFEIPTEGSYLPKVPPRTIQISENETTHVRQAILPHYASFEAAITLPKGMVAKLGVLPKLTLKDSRGRVVLESVSGQILSSEMIPGQYTLHFEDHPELVTPEPIAFTAEANEEVGPLLGRYELATGSGSITFSTGPTKTRLDSIRFWLTGPDGSREMYPKEDAFESSTDGVQRTVTLENLTVGEYQVDFLIPNSDGLFSEVPSQTLRIEKGEVSGISQIFPPRFSAFTAQADFEENCSQAPVLTLVNREGKKVLEGQGELSSDSLTPGEYTLVFGDVEGFKTPAPKSVSVLSGEKISPIVGAYETSKGTLMIAYEAEGNLIELDGIKAHITDSKGNTTTYPQYGNYIDDGRTHQRKIVLSDMPVGTYTVAFTSPEHLKAEKASTTVNVRADDVSEVETRFTSILGSLSAVVNLPEDYKGAVPKIFLEDTQGNIITQAQSGQLIASDLMPGEYVVTFQDIEGLHHTATVPVTIQPREEHPPVASFYTKALGNLVVSYSSNADWERVDRIRFWVIDSKGHREMYPKAGQSVDNHKRKSRTVTIDDITEGEYTVSFLLPNSDGLFEEIPDREVTVSMDGTSRIQESIEARYGKLFVEVNVPRKFDKANKRPSIVLTDSTERVIAETDRGELNVNDLVPGMYTVTFTEVPGLEVPEPRIVHVEPGEILPAISETVDEARSSLIVNYGTDGGEHLDDITFTLTDTNGKTTTYPQGDHYISDDATGRRKVIINDLPVGTYTIAFQTPGAEGLFGQVQETQVSVSTDQPAQVEQLIAYQGGKIDAIALVPASENAQEPVLTLKDGNGAVVATSTTGEIAQDRLPPGPYTVVFSAIEGFEPPPPISIDLMPGEETAPLIGQYKTVTGSAVIAYDTEVMEESIDDVYFWISNEKGYRERYPKQDANGVAGEIVLEDLDPGEYTLEFGLASNSDLFFEVPPKKLTVVKGETSKVHQSLTPRPGGIHAHVQVPQSGQTPGIVPAITIKDRNGNTVSNSTNGAIKVKDLAVGQYTLVFEKIADYKCPKPMTINITPNTVAGPFVGKYIPATGTLVVSYKTGECREALKNVRFSITDRNLVTTTFPVESQQFYKPDADTCEIVIRDIPVGEYSIEFFVREDSNLFPTIPAKKFQVHKGTITTLHQDLKPRYASVEVKTQFAEGSTPLAEVPDIILLDRYEKAVASSLSGALKVSDIEPGRYEVVFGSVEGFTTPEPIQLEVEPNDVIKNIIGEYQAATGRVEVTYSTDMDKTLIDEIKVVLRNENGQSRMYPDGNVTTDVRTLGHTLDIEDLPVGKYTVQFISTDNSGFFPEVPEKEILVKEGQTVFIEEEISLNFSSFDVAIELPTTYRNFRSYPEIKVVSEDGKVERTSLNGKLKNKKLPPGRYTVTFEEISSLVEPDPVTIELLPGEVREPVIGTYKTGRGSIQIEYWAEDAEDKLNGMKIVLRPVGADTQPIFTTHENSEWSEVRGKYINKVKNVPVGNYRLEFEVDDPDEVLAEVPMQDVYIVKNDNIIVEQEINSRYGSVEVHVVMPSARRTPIDQVPWDKPEDFIEKLEEGMISAEELSNLKDEPTWPKVRLINESGYVIAEDNQENITFTRLPPGYYKLVCEELSQLEGPDPVMFEVKPNAITGPILAEYQTATGVLAVRFDTGKIRERLNEVDIVITGKNGSYRAEQRRGGFEEDPERNGKKLIIPDIPIGEYNVSFRVPNEDQLFLEPPVKKIKINKGQRREIVQSIMPNYGSLNASISFIPAEEQGDEVPVVYVKDANGQIRDQSTTGVLHTDILAPGEYTLVYGDTEKFFHPEPVTFAILPGETAGPFHGTYEIGRGTIELSYETGPLQDRLERVRFWLVDAKGRRTMYPKGDQYVDDPKAGTRTVKIADLPVGAYFVEFVLPNTDNLFTPVSNIPIIVKKSETFTHKQKIVPQYGEVEVLVGMDKLPKDYSKEVRISIRDRYGDIQAEAIGNHLITGHMIPGEYEVVFSDVEGYLTPDPIPFTLIPNGKEGPLSAQYRSRSVSFSISTNNQEKGWKLYQNGSLVEEYKGSKGSLFLPPGKGYYIEAEEIPGFIAKVQPEGVFELRSGEPFIAQVSYNQQFGFIDLEAPMVDGELVGISLWSETSENPIRKTLEASAGKVIWKSDSIPIGSYLVSYDLPYYYNSIKSYSIEVKDGETTVLNPGFKTVRKTTVESNLGHAKYTLVSLDNGQVFEGKGEKYTFEHLPPGQYTLSFDIIGKSTFIAPPEQTLTITKDQDKNVKVAYEKGSSLIVSSNAENYTLSLERLDGDFRRIDDIAVNKTHTFTLPEGQYRVHFHPLEGPEATQFSGQGPDAVEIVTRSTRPERVHGVYEANRGSLVVTSNLPSASYIVRDITDPEGLVIGKFRGEYNIIPMTYVGEYEIEFEDIPNYRTPEKVRIIIAANERKVAGGSYLPLQKVARIEKGPSIVGDVFGEGADDEKPARTVEVSTYSIGIYPVTNAQYASWLTKAHKEGKIKYVMDHGLRGQIVDMEGHILCETIEADPNSQIETRHLNGGLAFSPIKGRENFPVIEVSWFGANAYCRDNNLRLPTEAEWEKAASMAISHLDEPLKKFRYAFGQDHLDKSLANYVESHANGSSQKVGTTEVGYYNGINLLNFSHDIGKKLRSNPALVTSQYGTSLSKSPNGCYDMSGNVREWVADWYDSDYFKSMPDRDPTGPGHGTRKVTKGGSYDSFAYELRCSARLALPPETTDAYTGFRVVIE